MKAINLLPKIFTNRAYDNCGMKMGDNDGPAYVVYGALGSGRCSMDIDFSSLEVQNVRASDGKTVNGYMFLGCDIYSGNNWINCFDTGFCYSGNPGRWHLFYNIYDPAEGVPGWYESNITLDGAHNYRLELDTLRIDGYAMITVFDLDENVYSDIKTFPVKGLCASGRDTACLMNFALDYPPDTKFDRSGAPSEDFAEITLYNTDEGLKLKNICVTNARIWYGGREHAWLDKYTDHRGLWPDISFGQFDYDCTRVTFGPKITDSEFVVDLDMNR